MSEKSNSAAAFAFLKHREQNTAASQDAKNGAETEQWELKPGPSYTLPSSSKQSVAEQETFLDGETIWQQLGCYF